MDHVKNVLSYAIVRELLAAQDEGLVQFAHRGELVEVAERIATKLTQGRDEYRSGRRGFDRLRDTLWRALRWRPGKGRRHDDGDDHE